MIRHVGATAALLVLLAAGQAHAKDRITLTSGRALEGLVLQQTESRVQFELDGTAVWIEWRHVKSISRGTPAPENGTQEPAAGEKGQSDTAETPTETPKETMDAAAAERLARRLESPKADVRAAAAKALAAAWPSSSPALEKALSAESAAARVEAVRILDREELGDTHVMVLRCLRDGSADVRMHAARVTRHRAYRELEPELLKLVRSDREWKVRQEALRALEVVGSRRCLQPVVAQLSLDEDPTHTRRYRRVLEALLGEHLGDDLDAWRAAVERVVYGDGKLANETTAAR